jgi:hypothetical protein
VDDCYVWDSWVADDRKRYHLFFLRAPQSIEDPANRHINAEIGHATSAGSCGLGLPRPTLQPSEIGQKAFDDMAIWTGLVLNDGRQWWEPSPRPARAAGHQQSKPGGTCRSLRFRALLTCDLPRLRRAVRCDVPASFCDALA